MPRTHDTTDAEGSPIGSTSDNARRSGQHTPLVIVSAGGRHDEASRRLVRAQAARASAPQSRITRARNREEREARDSPHSPSSSAPSSSHFPVASATSTSGLSIQMPLTDWLPSVSDLARNPIGSLVWTAGAASSNNPLISSGSAGASPSSFMPQRPGSDSGMQLPLAIPRGFVELQRRTDLCAAFLTLVSRAACFDFDSPGVDSRLHQLITELVLASAGSGLNGLLIPGHPIQGHVRIACICLTIFQGQRADGQTLAHDPKYQAGLQAAWSEATLLDQGALNEPKTAQASLWTIIIISVTTGVGATADFFHQLLHSLLRDLNVSVWEHLRSMLLDFIFPVSLLDEPCKEFFHGLQNLRIGFG